MVEVLGAETSTAHVVPPLVPGYNCQANRIVSASKMNTKLRKRSGKGCYCNGNGGCRHTTSRLKVLSKAEAIHMRRVVQDHNQVRRWEQIEVSTWFQGLQQDIPLLRGIVQDGAGGRVQAMHARMEKKRTWSCYNKGYGARRAPANGMYLRSLSLNYSIHP